MVKFGKIIIFVIIIILILPIFFIISNMKVKPTGPTVTFTVVSKAKSFGMYYRISNSTSNGWSPFKWSLFDTYLTNKKTITISQNGSIYFYCRHFKYKYGGGLKINGKDIIEGSTININARIKISPSGGEVYLDV